MTELTAQGGRSNPLAEADVVSTLRAARATPTDLWNDSADADELAASIAIGAVGATCNPVIALTTLRKHADVWEPRLRELARQNPTASNSDIGWLAVEELSTDAARLLEATFVQHHGRNGRVSVQTDPRLFRNAEALIAQAEHLSSLAPNIIVKIPATQVGIEAMREATFRGVSVNATVSFTVAQAVAVGEAIEDGLTRREAAGLDVSMMGPVCTIMGGRLDDWLRVSAEQSGILIDPGYYEWAGVAALKRAYQIFVDRRLRTRILSAAFRNHMQWSELIGGDLVVSPPFEWQRRINENNLAATSRIDVPVDERIVNTLYDRLPEFRRAYDNGGMSVEEFESFGATRRTLRQFLQAMTELETYVRDVLVPDPD